MSIELKKIDNGFYIIQNTESDQQMTIGEMDLKTLKNKIDYENGQTKVLKTIEEDYPTDEELSYLYVNEDMLERQNLTQTEREDGRCSESRLMHYLFNDIILANALYDEHVRLWENADILYTQEDYDDENSYVEEFQHFIVNTDLSADAVVNALKRANCGISSYVYDRELDLYFIGLSDLGTSRDIVDTRIRLTTDWEKHNIFDDYDEPNDEEDEFDDSFGDDD